MLTTHPDGFRILFNSDGANADDLKARFERESTDQLLPARLRFSLAHELAHTLFYDLSESTPRVAKELRSGGKRTALENLERNCNNLAATMLLPMPMLKAAFRKVKAISPESLLNLAHRAGVSVEVLVRRLDQAKSVFVDRYFRGCIVLVREADGEATVAAIAKPQRLNIAQDLLLMRSGEQWQLSDCHGATIDFAKLSPTSIATLSVETPLSKTSQDYLISVANVGKSYAAALFLAVFEEVGVR